jgi:hypothetical protein
MGFTEKELDVLKVLNVAVIVLEPEAGAVQFAVPIPVGTSNPDVATSTAFTGDPLAVTTNCTTSPASTRRELGSRTKGLILKVLLSLWVPPTLVAVIIEVPELGASQIAVPIPVGTTKPIVCCQVTSTRFPFIRAVRLTRCPGVTVAELGERSSEPPLPPFVPPPPPHPTLEIPIRIPKTMKARTAGSIERMKIEGTSPFDRLKPSNGSSKLIRMERIWKN